MEQKKILFIISHDSFDDEEYSYLKKRFMQEGILVETASTHLSEAKGKYGGLITPDCLISYVEAGDYDGFVFIGEEAASEYYSNADVLQIINQAHLTGKIIAAIGQAVPILAYSGKMANLLVSGDVTEKSRLEELGAIYSTKLVSETANFITASPEGLEEFGNSIANSLLREQSGYLV